MGYHRQVSEVFMLHLKIFWGLNLVAALIECFDFCTSSVSVIGEIRIRMGSIIIKN